MKTMCIIGAGSIGALKDDKFDSPKTKNIFTQAHAAFLHPNINLIGICDVDLEKANKAAKKWDCYAYINMITMIKELSPDILSVCVPTDLHYQVMKTIFELSIDFPWMQPKVVICEKPFCSNHKKAQDLITYYKDTINVPIIVDYIRRFDSSMRAFKREIEDKKIYSCRIIYGRGLKRDGCHGIDICNYLFGKNKSLKVMNKLKDNVIKDGEQGDMSLALYGRWEKCDHVIFTPVDSKKYSVFEIDVLTEDGRDQFIDNGLQRVFYGKQKSMYGNYPALSSVPEYSQTSLNTALLNLIDNAFSVLHGWSKPICTGEDALEVHRLINV